jgi:putative membrane protein
MRLLSLLALTFAVLLGVSFAILNADPVTVHYFLGVRQIPLSILIMSVWVLGIIIGLLASSFTILKLKMELRHLHSQSRDKR